VNPTVAATGACTSQNPGNCDFTNKSTPVNVTIIASQQPSGDPTVTSFSPDHLLANSTDQTLTLTGTNFQQGGAIFVGQDQAAWVTTWISSTQASAVVTGDWLTTTGQLTFVGYVNPTPAATGACTAQNAGNCDWAHRSNMVTVPKN